MTISPTTYPEPFEVNVIVLSDPTTLGETERDTGDEFNISSSTNVPVIFDRIKTMIVLPPTDTSLTFSTNAVALESAPVICCPDNATAPTTFVI